MTKRPLKDNQVRTLRKLVASNPLHSLLLNLSVDLMLRGSDLLNLKVADVMNHDRTPKDAVQIKQKKTKKITMEIPLTDHSKKVIVEHLSNKDFDRFIFTGQKSHYTQKPISLVQYQRIVKGWMKELGIRDDEIGRYSTHSMRKTKSAHLYKVTNNVEAVRRLLGHQNVTATSTYLGVEDGDAAELARTHSI